MKLHCQLFYVLLVVGCSIIRASEPEIAPPLSGPLGKSTQLFNGKNLDGLIWYQRPPKEGETAREIDQVWSVRDGVLHCKGKPAGYIRTEKEYDNYVLTVEQRHIGKGNGGILFAISGPDKIWPHCLEAQGANGEEGDIRNVADFKLTMEQERVEPKRLRRIGPSLPSPMSAPPASRIWCGKAKRTPSLRPIQFACIARTRSGQPVIFGRLSRSSSA